MMVRLCWILLVASGCFFLLSTGQARAQVEDCDETPVATNLPRGTFTDARFDAEDGDKLNYSVAPVGGGVNVLIQVFDGGNLVVFNNVFNAQTNSTFVALTSGVHTVRFINQSVADDLTVSANCSLSDARRAEQIDQAANLQANVVFGAASAATSFSSAALSGAMNSRSAGGAVATANSVTFSTKNGATDSGWTAWGSLAFTHYNGQTDGSARALTMGLDYASSPRLLIGAMATVNTYEQTSFGAQLTGRATEIGPYLVYDLGNSFDFEAFLTYGRPEYNLAGSSLQSVRVSGGAKIRAAYEVGDVALDSHLSVRGFNEVTEPFQNFVPQRTVEEYTASIGSTATFAISSAWSTSVGFGVDGIVSRDGRGNSSSWVAPRAILGLRYRSDLTTFVASINAGRAIKDTTDVTLGIGLSVQF